MTHSLRLRLGLAAAILLAGTVATAVAQVRIPASTRPDFNGDGTDDLAVGVPGENTGAGGIHVFYGSRTGITTSGNRFFTQNSADIPGGEENYDHCGASLTHGDFNGDGYADLAFGCPGEDTPASAPSAGAVMVLYGSSTGLRGLGSQFWSQNSPGISGGSESNDRCGTSLASGDINRDGFADLVWGCPGEDVGTVEDAGAVNVVFGSAAGLTATGNRFLSEDSPGLPGELGTDEACGTAVAIGDFNADGFDDVAYGCPGQDIFLLADVGAIAVAFGISSGISGTAGKWLTTGSGHERDEAGDKCGQALGVGDFDNDGDDELVVGCPGEDAGPFLFDAGSINVKEGHPDTSLALQSSTMSVFGGSRGCGAAVATGRFNNDAFADVAIGCSGSNSSSGEVLILRGTATLAWVGVGAFTQDSFGVPDSSEAGDHFGHALTAADFDNDGFSDLAVGVPGEDITFGGAAISNAGAVNVLYFPLPALDPIRSQIWDSRAGDLMEPGDAFGSSMPNSSNTPLPGLTGQWGDDLTLWCRGASCGLTGTFTAINPSLGPTPRVALRFYLSDDNVLDDSDLLIDTMPVKPLDMNESQVRQLHVVLPPGTDAAGRFVIALVDADDIVEEANEANNVVASPQIE